MAQRRKKVIMLRRQVQLMKNSEEFEVVKGANDYM